MGLYGKAILYGNSMSPYLLSNFLCTHCVVVMICVVKRLFKVSK